MSPDSPEEFLLSFCSIRNVQARRCVCFVLCRHFKPLQFALIVVNYMWLVSSWMVVGCNGGTLSYRFTSPSHTTFLTPSFGLAEFFYARCSWPQSLYFLSHQANSPALFWFFLSSLGSRENGQWPGQGCFPFVRKNRFFFWGRKLNGTGLSFHWEFVEK